MKSRSNDSEPHNSPIDNHSSERAGDDKKGEQDSSEFCLSANEIDQARQKGMERDIRERMKHDTAASSSKSHSVDQADGDDHAGKKAPAAAATKPGAYAANDDATDIRRRAKITSQKREIERTYGSGKKKGSPGHADEGAEQKEIASYWENKFTRQSVARASKELEKAKECMENDYDVDDDKDETAAPVARKQTGGLMTANERPPSLEIEEVDEVMRSPQLRKGSVINTSNDNMRSAIDLAMEPGFLNNAVEYEIDLEDSVMADHGVGPRESMSLESIARSRSSGSAHSASMSHNSTLSVPGAFSEQGPGVETNRRSSAVEEVMAALGQHLQPDGRVTNASCHTVSTFASGSSSHHVSSSSHHINLNSRSNHSSPAIRNSGRPGPDGFHESYNSSYEDSFAAGSSSEVEDGEDGGHDNMIQAKRISAQPIFEAEQVERDYSRRNQIIAVLACILALTTMVVTVTTVLTRDPADDNHDLDDGIDPRCKVPLSEQSVPVRCMCSDNLSAQDYYYEQLDPKEQEKYGLFAEMFDNLGVINVPEGGFDPDSCQPENQALLVCSGFKNWGLSMEEVYSMYASEAAVVEFYVVTLIYIVMDGINWVEQDMWSMTPYICMWYGLDCLFVDTVHDINLSNNGLTGSLPSELQHLTSIRYLDLSSNLIEGTQNNITGSIPAELGKMTALMSLDLSNLDLIGTIPPELGLLQRLSIVQLRLNHLTGAIPGHIFAGGHSISDESADRTLQSLNLAQNQLTGTIPTEIGLSTRLVWLRLQGNGLSGSLPTEIERLSSLELLNLGDNNFSGEYPDVLGRLPRLEMISLQNSGFSGKLPESFCESTTANGPVRRQLVVQCDVTEDCTCCSRNKTGLVDVMCFEDLPPEALGLDDSN